MVEADESAGSTRESHDVLLTTAEGYRLWGSRAEFTL